MEIEKVEFLFSEASLLKFGPFATLKSANAALRKITPPDIGYYKTDFKITFDDGSDYTGRYDIGSDAPSLEEHILNFCVRVESGRKWKSLADQQKKELLEIKELFQRLIKQSI